MAKPPVRFAEQESPFKSKLESSTFGSCNCGHRENTSLLKKRFGKLFARRSRGEGWTFLLTVRQAKGQSRRLELDEELLGQYLAAVRQAKRKYQLSGDFNVSLLYSIPDLLQVREVEVNAAAEREGVFKILDHALTKLERAREREGRQLKSDMQSQIRHLKRISTLA